MIFSLYMKISESTYYQINKETLLNRTKEYYKNDKGVLQEKARKKFMRIIR